MSFVVGVDELSKLNSFMIGLTRLSEETGVWIEHYERVTVKLPMGETIMINTRVGSGGDPVYVIDERDAS